MFAGSSPGGVTLCEGGVVTCSEEGLPLTDDLPLCPEGKGWDKDQNRLRVEPGDACSLSLCRDYPCPDALKNGAPIDPIQCRDISKAQAKAINAALVKKDAAISKCIASPASCHPEAEFAGGEVLEQCWGE